MRAFLVYNKNGPAHSSLQIGAPPMEPNPEEFGLRQMGQMAEMGAAVMQSARESAVIALDRMDVEISLVKARRDAALAEVELWKADLLLPDLPASRVKYAESKVQAAEQLVEAYERELACQQRLYELHQKSAEVQLGMDPTRMTEMADFLRSQLPPGD